MCCCGLRLSCLLFLLRRRKSLISWQHGAWQGFRVTLAAPYHARGNGGPAGAALRPDRQHELDRGHRHRSGWQCVLRCNQDRSSHSDAALFAMELGPHGITVNAVAPGFVPTDMTLTGRGATDWQGTEERFAALAMMGRIGESEDIANAVVFLASPESGWITAQMLTVDGGRMDYIGHG